jgi:WD40 repeat protein/serine/threonine protein kinase
MSIPPDRIETLFFAALEQRDELARSAFLDRACGGDAELRRRIEELLDAELKVGEFLGAPAVAPGLRPEVSDEHESPDDRIGPYRLLRMIGEGGMGVVYLAEQSSPIHRKVALKIIKPGMDTRQVIARFEAERQALALMDHPGIARVIDGGSTHSGRSYFVMELVSGSPITQYCDRERLSVAERLRLFILVCQAVQHAHQKGIIHRDLKPSNILVTDLDGSPRPKVIDFGIAKAIGQTLTDKTILTGLPLFVGTPRYMSPEQAELGGIDIDTRSDIYSLGVLLYELLTGTTPFDGNSLREAPLDEVLRIIRHEEPARPSARLVSLEGKLARIASLRSCDARRLILSIRGEIDWVVLKCLEKDRSRRYETANGLARDLMRYLADQPVEACPPSAWYRFTKYTRRNRLALTTMGMIALALVAGTAISTWQAIRATTAEKRAAAALVLAERNRQRADRLSFASLLRLAQAALDQNQHQQAQALLDQIGPRPGSAESEDFAWNYLRRIAFAEIVPIGERERRTDHFALAPDGRQLAYATQDGDVVLWDLGRDRRHAPALPGKHALTPKVLAFSSDGTRLASAGVDWEKGVSEVLVWELPSRRLLARFDPGGRCALHDIRFTERGRSLALSLTSDDPDLEGMLYLDLEPDPSRPRRLARFPHARIHVTLPDGGVVEDAASGRIRRLGLRSGEEKWSISASSQGEPPRCSTSGDGRRLVLVVPHREATVLDSATGTVIDRLPLAQPVLAPLASEDASVVVFPEPSSGALIWDRRSHRTVRIEPKEPTRTDVAVHSALSRDGRFLALSSRGWPGGQLPLVIHDTASGKAVATYPGRRDPLGQLEFDADGRSLILNSSFSIQRWFFDQPGPVADPSGHGDEAWAVAFSPDGRVLASGSDDDGTDDTLRLWDTATARLLGGWRAHPGTVSSLAFSPDGRTLASAGLCPSENLRLWDVATGRLVASLDGHTDRVRSLGFSKDGALLVSTGSDRTIRLWDVRDGHALATLRGHTDTIRQVAFSADDRYLASAANDRYVFLWDIATGKVVRSFRTLRPASAVQFSPDGAILAAADEGGDINLWDATTGEKKHTIHSDHDQLFALVFSPDGRSLAAAGGTHVIRLWDSLTAQELLTLSGHRAQINDLAFSPDGRILASCSHDGAVKLWRSRR